MKLSFGRKKMDFEEWCSNILSSIHSQSFLESHVNEIISHVTSYKKNGSIMKPYETETQDFLFTFSPKLIDRLLSIKPQVNSVAASINKIFQSYISISEQFVFQRNQKLMSSIYKIIMSDESLFYNSLDYNSFSETISPFYKENRKLFAGTKYLLVCNEHYVSEMQFNPEFDNQVLRVLLSLKEYWSESDFMDCIEHYSDKFIDYVDKIKGKKIRDIPDKELMTNFTMLIDYLGDGTITDDLIQCRFEYCIRMLKSEFLSKQYSALQVLMASKTLTRDQIQAIRQEFVIDSVLEHLHQETLHGFVWLLKTLLKSGHIEDRILETFWYRTISQYSFSIENFLKEWEILVPAIPEQQVDAFWKSVANSKVLPIETLNFLINVHEKVPESSKLQIFYRLFNSNEGNNNKNYSKLLCKAIVYYIPEDEQIRSELQELSLNMLEENKNPAAAISCLQTICKNFEQEEAQVIIRKIINNAKNLRGISTYLLNLISSLLEKFKTELSADDFTLIKKCFNSSLDVAPEEFEKFLLSPFIASNKIITLEMKMNYFEFLAHKKSTEPSYIHLVFALFNQINKEYFDYHYLKATTLNLRCLDDLWAFYFTTSSTDVIKRICQIYSYCPDPENIRKFIDYVTTDPIDINKISAIETMMEMKEGRITGRNQNRWDNDTDLQKVPVTGDFTGLLLLPDTILAADLKKIFADMLAVYPESITLRIDKRIVTGSVNLSPQTMLEVKTNSAAKFSFNNLPSSIILRSGLYNKVLPFLSCGNEAIEKSALNILNMIPTPKETIDELTQEKPNWPSIFNKLLPYRLSYYLSAIGKMTIEDNYSNTFFINGGAEAFFDTLFYDDNFCHHSLVVQILSTIMTAQVGPGAEITRGTMLATVPKERISFIFEKIAQLAESNTYIATKIFNFALMIAQANHDIVENNSFNVLIKACIFSKELQFRNYTSTLAHYSKIDISTFLPLLPLSRNQYCGVYFNLLKEAAVNATNEDWRFLVEFFKTQFPTSNDFVEQLYASYPPLEFVDRIFSVLTAFPKKVRSDELDLMRFILQNILLNTAHLYTSNAIYKLLIEISSEKSYHSELLSALSAAHKSFESKLGHPPAIGNKFRGLKNLGATCYMNAALQVLFSVPEFTNQLLSLDTPKDSWLHNLQLLFAQMKFLPDSVIDPSFFAAMWLDFDGQPINVRQQQDSLEFLQGVIDRANDVIKGLADPFSGEFLYAIKGMNTDFHSEVNEKFTVFPVEIEGYHKLSESFEAFLQPTSFTGSNQYLADGLGKIDATRTQAISKAPDTLIMQLNRFTFDMQSGERHKIGSVFEFPLELDLKPILAEGVQAPKYNLSSVIVHYGTAQSGHYTCYILKDNQWYNFNDGLVTEFEDNIVSESKGVDGMHYESSWSSGKPSAYVLVYRNSELKSKELRKSKIAQDIIDCIKPRLSHSIMHNILTSKEYCEFFLQVCDEGNLLFEYLTRCLTTSTGQKILDLVQKKLQVLVGGRPDFANYVLSQHENHFTCLLTSPSKEMRNCYAEVLCAAMQAAETSSVENMLCYLESRFDEIMQYWQNFDEFFLPFLQSVTLNCSNEHKLIPLFFKFLEETIPNYAETDDEFSYSRINISSVFKLLVVLLSSPQSRQTYQATVFSPVFLDRWFQSTHHAIAFSQLLRSFVIENKDLSSTFFTFFSNNAQQLSPAAAAGHFSVIIASNTDQTSKQIGWVFSFLKSKPDHFIASFLSSLIEKITESHIDFTNAVLTHANIWVGGWLTSDNPHLRHEIKRFIISVFDSQHANSRVAHLTERLLERLPELASVSLKRKATFVDPSYSSSIPPEKRIPAPSFYKVLLWCMSKSAAFTKVVSQSKLLNDTLIQHKKLDLSYNKSIVSLLNIITMIPASSYFNHVDPGKFIAAFDNLSLYNEKNFDVALKALNYCLTKSPYHVANSQLLKSAVNLILCSSKHCSSNYGDELSVICRILTAPDYSANLASALFSAFNFPKSLEDELVPPTDLTLQLLRASPETSADFMKFKGHEVVHKIALSKIDNPKNLAILREFTDSFHAVNADKYDWFRKSLLTPLITFWSNSSLIEAMARRLAMPFHTPHDADEICTLLTAIATVSPALASIVIDRLSAFKGNIVNHAEQAAVTIAMAALEAPENSLPLLHDEINNAPNNVRAILVRAAARVKALSN